MNSTNQKRRPLLVGIIVDVSSSMQRNWKNRDSGKQLPRIEAIRDVLNGQIRRLAAIDTSENRRTRTVDIFCLGMGFKRPMYWSDIEITYGYEKDRTNSDRQKRTDVGVVCDILALSEIIPSQTELRRLEAAINRQWNLYAKRLLSRVKIDDDIYEQLRLYISSTLHHSAYEKLHRHVRYRLYVRLKDAPFTQRHRLTRWCIHRLLNYISNRETMIEEESTKVGIRCLERIKKKSRETFESNQETYTDFIRRTLEDFVSTQTQILLRLLTLGYKARRILDYFDETRIEELARRIYDHLDKKVRRSIKKAWLLNKGDLIATASHTRGTLSKRQVQRLTERCVQKYSWSILEPFVRSTVYNLFAESFREAARKKIPDWIGLAASREITRSLKQVVNVLPDALEHDIYSDEFMYGATPIDEAIDRAAMRFLDISYARREKILIIISDGEFETTSPLVSAQLLKHSGITIVGCCVSDRNVLIKLTSRLLGKQPPGAKLLFEIASTVDEESQWVKLIKQQGFQVPEGVKLFYQINQSDVLEGIVQAILAG